VVLGKGVVNDCAEPCALEHALELGCLIYNLVTAFVDVLTSLYAFDVYADLHVSFGWRCGIQLKELSARLKLALLEWRFSKLVQRIAYQFFPSTFVLSNFLIDERYPVDLA
jgi:hypothetical protein